MIVAEVVRYYGWKNQALRYIDGIVNGDGLTHTKTLCI